MMQPDSRRCLVANAGRTPLKRISLPARLWLPGVASRQELPFNFRRMFHWLDEPEAGRRRFAAAARPRISIHLTTQEGRNVEVVLVGRIVHRRLSPLRIEPLVSGPSGVIGNRVTCAHIRGPWSGPRRSAIGRARTNRGPAHWRFGRFRPFRSRFA